MAGGFREMEISKDARHFSLDSFANIPNSTESGIIFARLAYVKPLIPGTWHLEVFSGACGKFKYSSDL